MVFMSLYLWSVDHDSITGVSLHTAKPNDDDSSSTTDSALGNELDVASFTTAGMTDFSDVS